MFDEFDRYLAGFSDDMRPSDYWYDDAISHADELLSVFTLDDYTHLSESIDKRNDAWVLRFCEVAALAMNGAILKILLGILRHHNKELQIASLDSLRSILEYNIDVSSFKAEIETVIDSIFDDADYVSKISLSALRRLLKGETVGTNWKNVE